MFGTRNSKNCRRPEEKINGRENKCRSCDRRKSIYIKRIRKRGISQKVAVYINGKLNEFDSIEGYQRFPADMKATLLQLNIADDYFKAKAQAEKLEREIEAKEKEIYNLKHDLIAEQIQSENDKKEIKRLDTENRELLLNKAHLESSLEESLLGKIEDEDTSEKDETEQEDTAD